MLNHLFEQINNFNEVSQDEKLQFEVNTVKSVRSLNLVDFCSFLEINSCFIPIFMKWKFSFSRAFPQVDNYKYNLLIIIY